MFQRRHGGSPGEKQPDFRRFFLSDKECKSGCLQIPACKIPAVLVSRPGHLPVFARGLDMALDGREAFRTDNMLDAAGVLRSRVGRNTELCQPCGKQLMPLINHFGNGPAALGQINKAGVGNGNVLPAAQIFHRDAYAGFFEAKLVRDIHRAHDGKPAAQNEDGFEIVF